jgi:hypothetical protein
VGLQRERQRREPAEEVRADEAELRTPEREDDERDRDPARSADEDVARDPPRSDREAVAGTADAREGAADEDVHVAIERDVDPHRVGRRRGLTDCPDVEPETRPREVQTDRERRQPGEVHERRLVEQDRAEECDVPEAEAGRGLELVGGGEIREVELGPK